MHSVDFFPRLSMLHCETIFKCNNLTSLTLGNGFHGHLLVAFAERLGKLQKLHLEECSDLESKHLSQLSDFLLERKAGLKFVFEPTWVFGCVLAFL